MGCAVGSGLKWSYGLNWTVQTRVQNHDRNFCRARFARFSRQNYCRARFFSWVNNLWCIFEVKKWFFSEKALKLIKIDSQWSKLVKLAYLSTFKKNFESKLRSWTIYNLVSSAVPDFAQPWPLFVNLFEFSVSDLVRKYIFSPRALILIFSKNYLFFIFERSHAIHSKKCAESAILINL